MATAVSANSPSSAFLPNAMGADLDEIQSRERKRVLVVEDEPDTVFLLKQILRTAGYNVMGAMSGNEALRKVADARPDLILLDLMMPEMDGWQTFGYLREMSDVPVIIISAIGNKEEVVRALHMGVDDYVTKPFHNAEVVARVQTVLRRTGNPETVNRLVFPSIELVIDFQTQEVAHRGETVQLTSKEFAVLSVLARHAPNVVNYQTLAQQVWGQDTPEVRNRIKYLVYLLRRKFQSMTSQPDLIINVDRLGYKLQSE